MPSLIVPQTALTQLQAVNALISTLGEAPVATLTPPPTSDVEEALNRLNEVDIEEQAKGWHWNREDLFPLSLDGTSHVPLPDQTLRVRKAYAVGGLIDVTMRNGFLYDRINHTLVWMVAPKVDLIVRLDWDSTPPIYRSYVTLVAAQRFNARKQGANVVLQVNAEDVKRARTTLEQHEDEEAATNSVYGNKGVLVGLFGTGGLRRNRGGIS